MKPCVFFAVALLCQTALAADRTVREWTFDRPADLQDWQPNAHLREVVVTNGVLACRGAGSDPILELRPLLNVPASPWQFLEVRLRADRDGEAEFFWSNISTGRFGGFTQEKTTRFHVVGDGQWRSYRLWPFWHPEKKIVRLRFDLYGGARFEVASLRIGELAMPPAAPRADFDFALGAHGWQALEGAEGTAGPKGLDVTLRTKDGFLLSPPLTLDAETQNYVAVRLAVDRGSRATLFFATDRQHGLHSVTFPVEADSQEHTYNLDLLGAPAWRGRILALGLRPSDEPGAGARLRWFRASEEPQGPPQLKLVSFALEEALPRAGVAATLTALVSNTGGQTASNVHASLTLPPGIRVLSVSPADARLRSLGFGEEATFTWKLLCPEPLTNEARLLLSCDAPHPPGSGFRAATSDLQQFASARLAFTPPLRLSRAGYVPEPKPVRGPFEVGAYYFPGWKTASQWHPITRFPERKPVLGWYREGDPEVADWHIKWAVEHGLTFFAYDWYWSQGARQLEHALHDGYFQARSRHLLKFCLLWANHNAPGTSSYDDCVAVTRYWIEHYFRRPEHLTVDGKPVMIIFSPHRLTQDLGRDGVRRAFAAMRAECVRAGLKGLHLVACVGDAGQAREAAEEGYDAVTAYNWPNLGMTGEGKHAPFATLVEGYRRHWQHILEQSPIPLSPLPVCGGWDSRPWHGENHLVRFGRTPELFRRHLLDARQLFSTGNPGLGTQKLVLIEAWNEWGEGSYIEPHQQFGFGYLDAIREVFTDAPPAHEDVTPADAGRGPYDVPPAPPARTAWTFDAGDEGWSNTMNLADLAVREGALTARTTGNDPAFFGPPTQARAADCRSVYLRLKLRRADGQSFRDHAQLFWSTSRLAESEASSERFEVVGDGQWHDYAIPVSQNRRWRGLITRLRLDPCNQPGVQVSLDAITLR